MSNEATRARSEGNSAPASAGLVLDPKPARHAIPLGSRRWRAGWATAPGTCGELVQGVLASGEHFHVTCPISSGTTVTLWARPSATLSIAGLIGNQAKLGRALASAARLLETGPVAIVVSSRSQLQVAKGMGSSTADIVAGARAMASAYGATLIPSQLAGIATEIEVSDGTMYPGIVAFCRRTGEVLREFSWYPRFAVVMVIPRDTVVTDTVDFAGKRRFASEFEQLLACLDEAAAGRDPLAFARAATRSAAINQEYLPNPLFGLLHGEMARLGAAGVVVGHTGTLAGLLYPFPSEEPRSQEEALTKARRAARALRAAVPRDAQIAITLTAAGRLHLGAGGRRLEVVSDNA